MFTLLTLTILGFIIFALFKICAWLFKISLFVLVKFLLPVLIVILVIIGLVYLLGK